MVYNTIHHFIKLYFVAPIMLRIISWSVVCRVGTVYWYIAYKVVYKRTRVSFSRQVNTLRVYGVVLGQSANL